MKELGYKIFAILYRIFCIFPIQDKQVFLIMTHDAGPEGNVRVVADHMKQLGKGYQFACLRREDTYFGRSLKKMWHFFIVDAYKLARSKRIFLDNMFLPMAYFKVRNGVQVVQMWHGTGVIKKIGADANEGHLKELEQRANENNTHLIVSSETTKRIYGQSFSMPMDRVFITGMPRTDCFFNTQKRQVQREFFEREYPKIKGKKLVLYAPTFRDAFVDHPHLALSVQQLSETLGEEYVIGLRLHPYVARHYESREENERVLLLNSYQSLNTLLFATDILVTDYSSIVFEYAALHRPMVFYAYDLDDFSQNGRGFYWDYEAYVPGPVVKQEEALADTIREVSRMSKEEYEKTYHLSDFVTQTYAYQDGEATKRLAALLQL